MIIANTIGNKVRIGIFDISVPQNGLQQCADALIRVRSDIPVEC